MDRKAPIAVFDSGVGGISVLRVLTELMPEENYIYYGDSANAPYGEKTPDDVKKAARRVTQELICLGAKAIVIACNTATAAAAEMLRNEYPEIPIIGMEPAVKPASEAGDHPTVLVMATPLTLRQEKFRHLIELYRDRADYIDVPCHGLVELIESGTVDGTLMDNCLKSILDPYIAHTHIDAAVLGCTHYIHARRAIERALGGGTPIFDGAGGTARETKHRLQKIGMLTDSLCPGTVTIINSSNEHRMLELSRRLFGGDCITSLASDETLERR